MSLIKDIKEIKQDLKRIASKELNPDKHFAYMVSVNLLELLVDDYRCKKNGKI